MCIVFLLKVLDIEGPAPRPARYERLALRRPDPRRRSTQTWKFAPDGRLVCAHNGVCVQAKDGLFGLRPGEKKLNFLDKDYLINKHWNLI